MINSMQDCPETHKIAAFLSANEQIISEIVKKLLIMCDCNVVTSGQGLELRFDLSFGDMKAVFYFRNLFLEIATVDRDAEPLQFDEKLHNYHYFVSKASFIIKSKLEILLRLLKSDDTDKTIDEIFNEFNGERIIIKKMDNLRGKNGTDQNTANN
jgi:hypothetical protein